ncbi:MAG: helix-turn-helix domain-containing protein, partial [Pseudomonadota bacterium]
VQAPTTFTLQPTKGLEILKRAGTVVIPGWPHKGPPADPRLVKAIRAAHQGGARIVSICTGAFLLGEIGLLDHRRATTHWLYADLFRERFPKVSFDPEVLYVDEGEVMTSSGSAAGIDLLLHIVHKDYGASAANIVARRLVLPAHREGGQQQFIDTPMPPPRDAKLSTLLDQVRSQPAYDWSIPDLADKAGMSPRTFSRKFVDATGTSPGQWLLAERIRAARLMLEESDAPLTDIASRSGLGSFENFARRFKARVGVSPAAYRTTFKCKSLEDC